MHLIRFSLTLSFCLLLTTCGSDKKTAPVGPPAPTEPTTEMSESEVNPYEFDFDKDFKGLTPSSSLAEISDIFSESTVESSMIYLVDGIEIPGIIIDKGKPEQLEIFNPDIPNAQPELDILIRQSGSPWVSKEGIKIGTSLEELMRLNDAPITFSGFGWDYGGFISNFHGGKLMGYALRLRVDSDKMSDIVDISGEQQIRSDDSRLDGIPIVVREIEISLREDPIKIYTYLPGVHFERIRAGMTKEDLVELYGVEQVRDSQIHLGEGEYTNGTFLFVDTPNEVEILYHEEAPHRVERIRISHPETSFILEDVYQLLPGLDMAGLEALNGGPLEFAGFGWDYEGTVLDWQGGELEGMGIVVEPLEELPDYQSLIGDIGFSSKELSPEQKSQIVVREIVVVL